ncbi:MAG: hypothetical protein CSA32_00445 [Desulfobulbus propionicus]|nr:MAG: hypothetical protein CSA32_00445 [Desulfobulbus propionicus]
MIGYVDAHIHLQDARYSGLEKQVIDRAKKHGVKRFFCNGTRESDWPAVLDLAAKYPEVVPFIGIHPWYANTVKTGWVERLRQFILLHGCGIGETGLDRLSPVSLKQQEDVFLVQLEMACTHNCPLVIHCVRMWGRLLEILEEYAEAAKAPPLMLHSFSGTTEVMMRLARIGAFFSYSCALPAPGRDKMRQVFAKTPLDQLLLETDSPDQCYGYQGEKFSASCNEPMNIIRLYKKAAQLRNMELEQFTGIVWYNGSVFTHQNTVGK